MVLKIDWIKISKDKRTLEEISVELNVDEKTIRRNLKKLGLKKDRVIRRNEENGNWKGNKVGKAALHKWIRRNKRKPKYCERCHKKTPIDLANKSGKYKRDVEDYEWLCRSCHMKDDGRIKKFMRCRFGKQLRDKKGKFVG